ncbi:MAG: ABC transporter ATP-binding protein [candidate division Zixibacteria bacterium]|nr:ABC transporter ATP-binding protein [candidate division Zixibacteria bacterium]
MAGLEIKNLSKSFDGNVILKDIIISVAAGKLMVVLGPSGCGKSTLLRLIAGLEQVDSGTIAIDGKDITYMEPRLRKTALVFQNYALYPHMTVFENIAFPLKVSKVSKDKIRAEVHKTAQLLELDGLLDRYPAQLSGGQRQRVALGRGLIREPSIFLLDEPLSNLDAALRIKMRQEIVALQKRLDITMIYVTHDQTEALTMADSMILLRDGIIQQAGKPSELYKHPVNSFVASFIGMPPMNLFDEEIKNGIGTSLPIIYGKTIADGKYKAGIRPEHIDIDRDGPISGTVKSIEYIGPVSHLAVQTENLLLTIVVDSGRNRFSIGDKIQLTINLEQVLLFQE